MDLMACQGLQASALSRQLLSGGGSHGDAGAAEQLCTCLPAPVYGTEGEHVMVQACLWVAFCLSVLILAYYLWCTFKGHCGWEEVYVVTVEALKTIMEVFYEAATPATITQFSGVRISWLRYGEWLLTCPVILIHLSNLTGLGQYNKRTMRLLVSDIGTIVCGVTAALCTGPAKIVFFLMGLCYGGSTFMTAAAVYLSAYKEVPQGQCKLLVKLCAWVFFGSWLLFPILFLMGPEGFGHLSVYGSIIAHTFADLLSKNLWGLLAHHLRNKIQNHLHKYGSLDAVTEEAERTTEAEGTPLKLGKAPATPRTTAAVAQAAADNDAIATITLGTLGKVSAGLNHGMPSVSPTKAHASLRRSSSGVWNAIGAGACRSPVRVLLGLPAEDAETVLQHFQQQFATLPVPAEALPATGPAALLSAAANASAFGGTDAALLHLSYLMPAGAPGSNLGLVDTLKGLGIRVYVYGCDAGGPPEDIMDSAAALDGWVEGPTWTSPLNASQLTALLVLMNAARTSRPPSSQGYHSQPASPRAISMRANSIGPILRSHSTSSFGPLSATPVAPSTRASLDIPRQGLSPVRAPLGGNAGSVRGTTTAGPGGIAAAGASVGAPVAPPSPAAPAPTSTGPSLAAAPASLSDAAILQQLMAEISRLRKELGHAG